jgi:hypothetical protein
MQYAVHITDEPRFKFREESSKIVVEQAEESKSLSSEESSLVTEEDTSGNPLPPEIIEIRKKNKKLQKDLTLGIMNFKSSSRSVLDSESSSQIPPNQPTDPMAKVESKKDLSQVVSSNEALKSLLDKILKLQSDFDHAKRTLSQNEHEISEREMENTVLKNSLVTVQEEVKTTHELNGCKCLVI